MEHDTTKSKRAQIPTEQNYNPFDSIPIEITEMILVETGKSMTIAGQCCVSWRAIARKQSPTPNKLFVSSVVTSVTLLQWAKDNGCPWNEWTCALIARQGHLSVLQWEDVVGLPRDGLSAELRAEIEALAGTPLDRDRLADHTG